MTVKVIRRGAPSDPRLWPERASNTYVPARSFASRLRLRSVMRSRPARATRFVTNRALPAFLPLRAL